MKYSLTFFLLFIAVLAAIPGVSLRGEGPGTVPAPASEARKPLIGIASLNEENYLRAVRESGGIPLVLPKTDRSPAAIDEYLEKLDALLMPGGADIPPSEWKEEPHPTTKVLDDERYQFEKALITAWITRTKKPLLGICLGSQWINVAHGGSLVQDIPSEFKVNHRDVTHPVTLEAGSRLAAIFGETKFEVNSFHHQAVGKLGTGLRIAAKSPEGVVEATETTSADRFLIGVQWHPEKALQTDARQRKLFRAFIDAAAAGPAARPASGSGGDAQKPKAADTGLIKIERGGLPIILAAPHGGRAEVPGVPERRGDGVARFVARMDGGTDVLTEKLADALEKKLGKRPYVVMARFHRKFIDANRPAASAYESELARPVYDVYHEALAAARKEITERWGSGLLLDIHGQATGITTIFRGTQSGKTVSHLIREFGEEAHIGEKSLGGLLSAQGFHVVPPPHSRDAEKTYSGGHTVIAHGSASGGTIDAIQLEFGTHHRSKAELPATAEKVANAVTAFAKAWLPDEEKAPPTDAAKPAGKIAIGVYLDKGAGPSSNDLLRALEKFEQVSVTKLTAAQIRDGGLKGLDILMHPGGSGGGQGRHLEEPGREKIRGFVGDGGGYIGICAGAYLATSHYKWSLNILDAKVIDTEHWNRGTGTVDIALTPAGREMLRTTSGKLPIHYAQGPLLAPANRPEIEDYEEMASFQTEIAKNGAPEGVMIGTTAIARGRFGQGRVICFSPHPEMTAGLESFVQDAIHFVRPQDAGK